MNVQQLVSVFEPNFQESPLSNGYDVRLLTMIYHFGAIWRLQRRQSSLTIVTAICHSVVGLFNILFPVPSTSNGKGDGM